MWGKDPDRKPGSRRRLVAAVALCALVAAGQARADDGFWDTVLEKMNVKPAPAAPAPGFVERTRPDPAGLGYLPTALPHKVSPRPVKTADEIEAAKAALDAAKARQLGPAPKAPGGAKAKAPGRAAPAVAD